MKYQHLPGGTEETHGNSVVKIHRCLHVCTLHLQNTDGRTLSIEQRMSVMVIGEVVCLFVCLFVCNVYNSISVINYAVLIYVNVMI
jgi:hypothetical protein